MVRFGKQFTLWGDSMPEEKYELVVFAFLMPVGDNPTRFIRTHPQMRLESGPLPASDALDILESISESACEQHLLTRKAVQ